MALFSCSECRGKVSDKASSCPHCGAPVESGSQPSPTEERGIPQERRSGESLSGLNHMRIPRKRPPVQPITEIDKTADLLLPAAHQAAETVDEESPQLEVQAQSEEPPSIPKGDPPKVLTGKVPQELKQDSEVRPESSESAPPPTSEGGDWKETEPSQRLPLLVSFAVIVAVFGVGLALVSASIFGPDSAKKQATWDDIPEAPPSVRTANPSPKKAKAEVPPVKISKSKAPSAFMRDASYRNSAVWRDNLRSSFEPMYSTVMGTYRGIRKTCFNLRVEPDHESNKKACLSDGTELYIQGKNIKWFAVTVESGRYTGLSGFVHSKWVK